MRLSFPHPLLGRSGHIYVCITPNLSFCFVGLCYLGVYIELYSLLLRQEYSRPSIGCEGDIIGSEVEVNLDQRRTNNPPTPKTQWAIRIAKAANRLAFMTHSSDSPPAPRTIPTPPPPNAKQGSTKPRIWLKSKRNSKKTHGKKNETKKCSIPMIQHFTVFYTLIDVQKTKKSIDGTSRILSGPTTRFLDFSAFRLCFCCLAPVVFLT